MLMQRLILVVLILVVILLGAYELTNKNQNRYVVINGSDGQVFGALNWISDEFLAFVEVVEYDPETQVNVCLLNTNTLEVSVLVERVPYKDIFFPLSVAQGENTLTLDTGSGYMRIDIDSQGPTPSIDVSPANWIVSISNNGRFLVRMQPDEDDVVVYVMDTFKEQETKIDNLGNDVRSGFISVLNSGNIVYMAPSGMVYVHNIDNGVSRPIVQIESQNRGFNLPPIVSPDNKKLAIRCSENAFHDLAIADIEHVTLDYVDIKVGWYLTFVTWSFDSKYICYSLSNYDKDIQTINIYDTGSHTVKTVGTYKHSDIETPVISPNNAQVAYGLNGNQILIQQLDYLD